MASPFAASVTALFLAAPLAAQFVGPGLAWAGSSGNFARSFVPYCANLPVVAVPGETVTLTVWGDWLSPFALFTAGTGSQCLQIPGLGGGLVLDFPITTVTFGVLNLTSPCLSCPAAFQSLQFVLPAGLPVGTSLALQAAALGGGNPAFTVAISGSV